jgi:hypothetical protein
MMLSKNRTNPTSWYKQEDLPHEHGDGRASKQPRDLVDRDRDHRLRSWRTSSRACGSAHCRTATVRCSRTPKCRGHPVGASARSPRPQRAMGPSSHVRVEHVCGQGEQRRQVYKPPQSNQHHPPRPGLYVSHTEQSLFEAVRVYTVMNKIRYLRIVNAQSSNGRYFRSFTATSLGDCWIPQTVMMFDGLHWQGRQRCDLDERHPPWCPYPH